MLYRQIGNSLGVAREILLNSQRFSVLLGPASCRFTKRHENRLIYGKTGAVKHHW